MVRCLLHYVGFHLHLFHLFCLLHHHYHHHHRFQHMPLHHHHHHHVLQLLLLHHLSVINKPCDIGSVFSMIQCLLHCIESHQHLFHHFYPFHHHYRFQHLLHIMGKPLITCQPILQQLWEICSHSLSYLEDSMCHVLHIHFL